MKPSEGGLLLCVLATVLLSGESAPRRLNSINDLKEVDFGRSVPKHSLLLLYWFANNININDNGIRLAFDPTTSFGSHRYYNIEGLLDQIEEEFHYYTIGNLNEDFPEYILHPPDRQYEGGNLDRIVVLLDSYDDSIYEVYLTQHTPGSSEYDPDHTYQISSTLLRQIRQFSTQTITSLRQQFHSHINDHQLNTFRSTWGAELVCLGLFLFILINERTFRIEITEKRDIDKPAPSERIPDDHSSQYRARNPERNYQHFSYDRGNNDNSCNLSCGQICCIVIGCIVTVFVIIGIIVSVVKGRAKP